MRIGEMKSRRVLSGILACVLVTGLVLQSWATPAPTDNPEDTPVDTGNGWVWTTVGSLELDSFALSEVDSAVTAVHNCGVANASNESDIADAVKYIALLANRLDALVYNGYTVESAPPKENEAAATDAEVTAAKSLVYMLRQSRQSVEGGADFTTNWAETLESAVGSLASASGKVQWGDIGTISLSPPVPNVAALGDSVALVPQNSYLELVQSLCKDYINTRFLLEARRFVADHPEKFSFMEEKNEGWTDSVVGATNDSAGLDGLADKLNELIKYESPTGSSTPAPPTETTNPGPDPAASDSPTTTLPPSTQPSTTTNFSLLELFNSEQTHPMGVNLKALTNLYSAIHSDYASMITKPFKPRTDAGGTKYVSIHYTQRNTTDLEHEVMCDLFLRLWYESTSTNTSGSNIQTQNTMQVDVTEGALFLMSNATHSKGQIILPEGEEGKLSDIGYTVLSAGVLYDPFVSIAGNESYCEVLSTFLDKEEDKEDVLKILHQAINIKKPLMVTEGSNTTWTNATDLQSIEMAKYRQARLRDCLQMDQEITRAYVMLRGGMSPSQVDASTWDYTQITKVSEGNTSEVDITDRNDESNTANKNKEIITSGADNASLSSFQVTTPVMVTCGMPSSVGTWGVNGSKGYAAAVGGLTSLIIHNASRDAKDNIHLKNADAELLFINGLGDIVLSDDTVILPAIANPLLFEYGEGYEGVSEDDFINTFGREEDGTKGYYPYNAAFMNHYAGAKLSEGKLKFDDTTHVGKYLILMKDGTLFAKDVINMRNLAWGEEYAGVRQLGGVRLAPIVAKSLSVGEDSSVSESALFAARGDIGTQFRNWLMTGVSFIGKNALAPLWGLIDAIIGDTPEEGTDGWTAEDRQNAIFVTRGFVTNASGQTMFPLVSNGADIRSSYVEVAGPIITSARRFLCEPGEGEGKITFKSKGTFRVDLFVREVIAESLLGTQYADTIVKNYQVSYEDLVADSGNRFTRFIVDICDNAISFLGTIDGVLAIKGPYANGFFNIILNFIQEFYLLICIGLMVVVAAKFFKGHYNMLYVVFLAVLCFAGFELYANWLPTALPSVYGLAVNDVVEDIVWNTTLYKAECYEDTYKSAIKVDASTGAPKPYTATITLYKLTRTEMDVIARNLNVNIKDIKTGRVVYLDYDAGIFVQGNEIKMSIDSLLRSNTLRGLYQSQWELLGEDVTKAAEYIEPVTDVGMENPYSLQLTNPYVSLESYYTPYDHIERAFLIQLNTLSSIFRMERAAYHYGTGDDSLYKDAFLVRSFLNSGIFTAPGNDEVLKDNIVTGSIVAEEDGTGLTVDMFIDVCNKYFAPQEDWLNLRAIFVNPDDNMRESLWGYMMQQRGYYNAYWEMTEEGNEKLSKLIDYVNTQTKVWVMRNSDNLLFCSDENAVKMISLYATTCFTHHLSQLGYWLYPNYINASDLALKDVLYGSMTTIRDRNFAYDGTAVNTVALNVGVFGVIFLLLITVFVTAFVFVITYLVPILYALFGAILIYKLINNDSGIGLVKGYVKVTLASAVLYLLMSLSLKLVRVGGYNWYGYLGCALVAGICLYFLFWVVLSVVQDVGELGNNTLTNNLLQGLNGLTFGAMQRVQNAQLNIRNSSTRNGKFAPSFARQYGRGYNVDEYGRPYASRNPFGRFGSNGGFSGFGRRGPGMSTVYDSYGRGSDYADYANAPVTRRQRFFNNVAGVAGGMRTWASSRRAKGTTRDTVDYSSSSYRQVDDSSRSA